VASVAEQVVSRTLRLIVADLSIGASIPESELLGSLLSGLEWFLPEILREIHPEWKYESLDGIYPVVARKTGDGEIEIVGQCILISDQTLTSIHVRMQSSSGGDAIEWLELRLGELGDGGMVRTPFKSQGTAIKRASRVAEHGTDAIDWCYKVSVGNRRA
jgi:hypothetical protein